MAHQRHHTSAEGLQPMIVFDCDGVLVDSEVVAVDTELQVLAQHGIGFERDEYVRRFTGLAPGDWHLGLATEIRQRTSRSPAPDLFETLDAAVERALEVRVQAISGAHAAVAAVAEPRCVASSTPRTALISRLQRTGLAELFGSAVFSADQVEKGKPAPDLFLHAASAMGAEPGDCVVVEDSLNGVRAARAAGMRAIGFTAGGHCPPDHSDALTAAGANTVVADFELLSEAIDELRARSLSQ